MNPQFLEKRFGLSSCCVMITRGGGYLGTVMACLVTSRCDGRHNRVR